MEGGLQQAAKLMNMGDAPREERGEGRWSLCQQSQEWEERPDKEKLESRRKRGRRGRREGKEGGYWPQKTGEAPTPPARKKGRGEKRDSTTSWTLF